MNNLICASCQKRFPSQERVWKCSCGGVLDIEFSASFPIEKIRQRNLSMWRYREAIPLEDDQNIITLAEGFTPLIPLNFAGQKVWIKQEHLLPTGSYKDRGASVLVSKIKELGINEVIEDSSGNAGCAIAAYCARAKIKCEIFVPQDTSPAKLAQIQAYGAKVRLIPGSREDTAQATLKAVEKIYYASHSWNPFFFQGTKTIALEICEQLGWQSPDVVILPVGNGTLLLGCFLGFQDLRQAGLIAKIPRLIGIQAASCAPLYLAWRENSPDLPSITKKETLAEGIAIAAPVRGKQILQAIKESSGEIMMVEEAEIKAALIDVSRRGFYIEPTAAATIAGVYKYIPHALPGETIVSLFSGHGLKATEKILKILASLH
ncbi:MAG: threonine synthase [Thermodesulfobacteriota bacterium]